MSEQVYHPLIEEEYNEENNWGWGDEETVCCDDCGKRFDLADAYFSIYTSRPICYRCRKIQMNEV